MNVKLNPYDYANIFTQQVNDDGNTYFNLYNRINIEGELDSSLYTIDNVYSFASWYQLSYKHYGTITLWWIILLANKITNPFDITSGMRVKILKKEVVTEILSQINNQ